MAGGLVPLESAGPIILSLETANLGGSLFLGRGKVSLATRIGDPGISHSNNLLSHVNDILEQAKLSLRDVEVFACASGPGSFTGLRIGIATLKALASTLQRPCVGIPTLQAVAQSAGPSSATVAVLPAGRGEVFAQMFSVSNDDAVIELDAAAHVSPQTLVEKYAPIKDLTWAGSGAHLQRELLANYTQQHGMSFKQASEYLSNTDQQPGWNLAAQAENLAEHVAALALHAFQSGRMESAHSLRAIYVRPSDAELKEQCR